MHHRTTPMGVLQYRDNEIYVVRESPIVDGRRPRVYQIFMYNYSSQEENECYIRLAATPHLCSPYPELDPNVDFVDDQSCIINTGDTVVRVTWSLIYPWKDSQKSFPAFSSCRDEREELQASHHNTTGVGASLSLVQQVTAFYVPWVVVNDVFALGLTTMTEVHQAQNIAQRTPPGCLPFECTEVTPHVGFDAHTGGEMQADCAEHLGYLPLVAPISGMFLLSKVLLFAELSECYRQQCFSHNHTIYVTTKTSRGSPVETRH